MDRALLPQDELSGSVRTTDQVHHEIHEGNHYTISYKKTLASAGSVCTILISTPAVTDGYLHFTCSVEADKKVVWTFSESPQATAGSVLTSYNNNRITTKTSSAVITANATITSVGTVFETHTSGSTSGGFFSSATGGSSAVRNEWILKGSTKYLIGVTSSEATTDVSIMILYYKHEK